MFVNGVLRNVTTGLGSVITRNEPYTIGCEESGTANFYTGYMTDFRFVNGSIPAAYQTSSTTTGAQSFVTPTVPLSAIANTSLLLNFTNAAITDATAKNVLETVGDARISTAQSKWTGGSMLFDGSGDYLTSGGGTSNLYSFGTGDFTIEGWIYFNTVTPSQVVIDFRVSPNDTGGSLYITNNGSLRWYVQNSDRIIGATLSPTTWVHFAVCRQGTNTKLFLNGTQSGSTFNDTFNYICGDKRPFFGALSDGTGTLYLNGYISDLRITKGYARYTANFTPPTGAFILR
jgi:hypothetical protein